MVQSFPLPKTGREGSRPRDDTEAMRFWTARRRRGAAARQLRRTNASWHLPFCASLSPERNCFFFDNAWICRFDCHGLFSKEKPGTSLTVLGALRTRRPQYRRRRGTSALVERPWPHRLRGRHPELNLT